MHYDHISFHTDGHWPPDLPESHALHHMGYYYAWAVSQNLHSPAAAALPQFADLQNGRISGAQFVSAQLNGGLDETCFNELGNRFTAFYYADEDEGYGRFMEDYFTALGLEDQRAFYRIPDRAEHQHTLSAVFQAAFGQWLASLKEQ